MKFCVIGVGRFGYHVAITLAENGMEVLAVDSNEAIIASIRDKVAQAVCMRVTDEESLRSIGADEMDICIVAMGENFAQSILVTALLKHELKVKTVITRSISEIHRKILMLIGADQIILPEQEEGIRLADTLSLPFENLIRLATDFCVSKLPTPEKFINKNINSLQLAAHYGVTCLGKYINNQIEPVTDDMIAQKGDILVISGTIKDLSKVAKV